MKLFKNIDDKLKDIGFVKIADNKYIVTYERKSIKYNYTQVLDICHKASGGHIVLSYDKDLMDKKGIGNTCVGLTYYEMKLIMKKMKQKGWKTEV